MDCFYNRIPYTSVLIFCMLIFIAPFALSSDEFDPDSIAFHPKAVGNYNPTQTLCGMNSWLSPVLDHNGNPHPDGHIIQIIADGGNGIQDPPNLDGSPSGDDTLAEGNFNIQYINGEKHIPHGLSAGMFIGMFYFISYKPNQSIYLRIWEGRDPSKAEYYQDSREFTTERGNSGGHMFAPHPNRVESVQWLFSESKKVLRK